ncbi:Pyrimidine 5'-nucleotidase YjjG [Fundidesulfovibrio magnetotacticus]|uniref:Pyrimidine 5'-nucleotidase YjjG n=1 Tax=Fundidesulfovibrio magnetotacticus TaxID=2730080 RepID=A0A6V8LS46_9BACT|nr:HAD family hydrolase [Fundidesulfovibrio magnetotacticus]GFK95293.1 Pyrimidine 5'-nucleotidase YjjG [Fundidesulfovibrio magnetotacticus]
MTFKAIVFDLNGTLVDINTDEGNEQIYRAVSHFLTYQGIRASRWEVRDEYYRIMDEQRRASGEEFPEFDAVNLWRDYLNRRPEALAALPPEKVRWMPLFLAEMYRGISRNRLELYPGVKNVLDELAPRYRLAALSDAQSAWAVPEMLAAGLDGYFQPVIVSGDLGYRKPDPRIFQMALDALNLPPQEVLFVGNDMYRDVFGAHRMGMKTVFFASNQGRKKFSGAEPDYIIYDFWQLRQAIDFLEAQSSTA